MSGGDDHEKGKARELDAAYLRHTHPDQYGLLVDYSNGYSSIYNVRTQWEFIYASDNGRPLNCGDGFRSVAGPSLGYAVSG